MLSPLDDYPIHQISEVMRHVATSDRNFYDRYYFNCYPLDESWFLLVGVGQYPNLGVKDAFAALRRGDDHHVVRASAALGADRMNTRVGPLRVDVVEGLQTLRVVCDPTSDPETGVDIAFDLTFTAGLPAALEPRHFHRQLERVTFDTQRFVQTGSWTGELVVGGETFAVDSTNSRGNRDRSWGVRPVGEAEPKGRRAAPENTKGENFFWIYTVAQFEEFSLYVVIQEDAEGRRVVEDAMRVWRDDPSGAPEPRTEWLGRPEHDIGFVPGTRRARKASMTFSRPGRDASEATLEIDVRIPHMLGLGTGYGLEEDWRHGMWQGPEVTQTAAYTISEVDSIMANFCPIDYLSRFRFTDESGTVLGTGLFEFAAIGPHEQYGFADFFDTAPAEQSSGEA